ncbi:MAG TPA: 4-hydroxy-tetrahydrodipicolinate reductase [Thermodesulfovibrionales bacterium]|nr:4-hydroxy-tetrahydrodipicolinate reductase [Thermodesulfovibrionales bacterium]
MTKIIVTGATGRMGSRIMALARDYHDLSLVGAVEREGHDHIGKDAGQIAGIGETGITLTDRLDEVIGKADVIIDFTSPGATLRHVELAKEKKRAVVIGTTGFSKDELKSLRSMSSDIPVLLAPNMSVGVNLLFKVLGDVARTLGDDYDVEIIEAHHRLKKDAPSGTAMKMAQVIAEALRRNLDEVAVFERKGLIGERKRKEIGMQTVRAGDIVGEHTVLFGGLGERIEITHKASSRDTFARGALRAALWLHGKPAGFYDMQDVLGLR